MMSEHSNPEPAQPEKPIRQWRVGTVSMGLILIALGFVLLMGRINDSFTLANLLKFWPIVLIILGVEMLLLNALTVFRGSRIRFTYDVLSVFLVLVLLLVSSGLVALESSGALDLVQRALHTTQRYVEAEKLVYTADQSLKALTMEIYGSTTQLRAYDGDQIKVSVIYNGYFASAAEADQYAEEQLVRAERIGENLFIKVFPPGRDHWSTNNVRQEVTVLIPQHLDVEIDQQSGSLKISLLDLQSNWVVSQKSSGQSTEVHLDTISDGEVTVELADGGRLTGNVEWDSKLEHESPVLLEANKKWGKGSHSLVIRQSRGSVLVNTR